MCFPSRVKSHVYDYIIVPNFALEKQTLRQMKLKCDWCIISKKGKNQLFHPYGGDFQENLS
jgi:hypothetical protein